VYHPSPFSSDEDADWLREDACITLLYGELFLDTLPQNNTGLVYNRNSYWNTLQEKRKLFGTHKLFIICSPLSFIVRIQLAYLCVLQCVSVSPPFSFGTILLIVSTNMEATSASYYLVF
jgi:hypothetical protein